MPKNTKISIRLIAPIVVAFILGAAFAFMSLSSAPTTTAAALDGFKPGNIISDAVMSDYTTMSVTDIQNFLTSKNSCRNTDYNFYLRLVQQYPHLSWHWSGEPYNGHFVCLSEERFGDGTTIGSGQTAAEIIYEAARANRINPQVLLVLLEKEQSLITDDYPNSLQYRSATGYGCPDTAACDSKYYGLKNQINKAAELFRYTLDNGYYAFPEKTSGVYVAYHPNKSCGSSEVWIENRATAALYRYTPYQPNSAAIAAGSGTGNACSSYGNRNFYLYFTKWFGSTQDSSNTSNNQPDVFGSIPDGVYAIHVATNPSKVLDVANGHDKNGANIQLWSDNNTIAQQWKITYSPTTNDYTIRNIMSDRALDLSAGVVKDGSNIQLYEFNDTCSQRWRFIPDATNDSYVIVSSCNTKYALDVTSGHISDGTNIQLWIRNGTSSQQWQLTDLSEVKTDPLPSDETDSDDKNELQPDPTPTPTPVGSIPDGVYAIHVATNPSKVLDVANGHDKNGANIQLWSDNNTIAQQWKITYSPTTNDYTIRNIMSDRALDLSAGVVKDGSNIQLYEFNDTCSQRWRFIPDATNDSYVIVSSCNTKYALDVTSGHISDGTNIQLWIKNDTISQAWKLSE